MQIAVLRSDSQGGKGDFALETRNNPSDSSLRKCADDYIERALEKLGLIKPGETVASPCGRQVLTIRWMLPAAVLAVLQPGVLTGSTGLRGNHLLDSGQGRSLPLCRNMVCDTNCR